MDLKRISKIMKALSNEKRLALFKEIATGEKSNYEDNACVVSNIMGCLKLSAPTISHHLKELTNAELITTEKKGKFLIAKIEKKTIREIQLFISSILEN